MKIRGYPEKYFLLVVRDLRIRISLLHVRHEKLHLFLPVWTAKLIDIDC